MSEFELDIYEASNADFAEFVKADYAKWGALVKASGIKLTD